MKEREDENESNVNSVTKELLDRAMDIVIDEICGKRYDETADCISRAVEQIDKVIQQEFADWSPEKRALLLCVVVGKTMTSFGKKMIMYAICEAAGINLDDKR